MYKKFIKASILADVLSFLLYASGTCAFAADCSGKTEVPKGVIILIMIVVFISSAVIAGITSYKIKTGRNKASEKDNTQNTRDQ